MDITYTKMYIYTIISTILNKNATIQAITHCKTTNPIAHFPPNSLFTEVTAATQGV